MNTKYGDITKESFESYKKNLIDRVYAILPKKEEYSNTVHIYIESLICEISGLLNILELNYKNSRFITIISMLESLNIKNYKHEEIKRHVFKIIKLIRQMREEG